MGTDSKSQTRLFILDSLLAQSGKVLTSALINELALEIVERLITVEQLEQKQERAEVNKLIDELKSG